MLISGNILQPDSRDTKFSVSEKEKRKKDAQCFPNKQNSSVYTGNMFTRVTFDTHTEGGAVQLPLLLTT